MRILLGCLLLLLLPGVAGGGALTGPILDDGVSAELVDVVQLPASAGSAPLARLNVLREAPDGSGRIFVNDLEGPLHVIDGVTVQTYMDLSLQIAALKTSPGLGSGFVSFAFHPGFATNGLFYTVHSEFTGATPPNLEPPVAISVDQHSVLTEWTASVPSANAFSGTSRELMRIAAPHRFHNLGEIAFDPSLAPAHPDYGLLYIGAGDFGSVASGQPEQLQRLDTVYGCVLRIDPLGGPFMRGGTTYDYGIPASNPFASDGDPDTWGEIFLYGVRNAHRLSWDPGGAETLFVGDIGEDNVEEVLVASGGANHGWPEREGTFALDVTVDPGTVFALPPVDPVPFEYPVAQYDHDEGIAIAGGQVVRGAPLSDLEGTFVFGDIVSGRLFYAYVDELLAADDGDPATTADVYDLHLVQGGAPTSVLEAVRDALGAPGQSRADLRIHRTPSGRIFLTTKGDGFVRELLPIATAKAPSAGALARGLLVGLLLLAGGGHRRQG